ncbi:MAG: SDR family NAD(P)-dependent oxidoreductase [Clostridiales bacterium]|nr:SDR family NAD(P)-dependent oxidoreductase [Clostridiales bacterium]
MKIAVVTGASSGMGREMIIQLWEHFDGFDEMWIIARRRERMDQLDCQLGVALRKFPLDLTLDRDRQILERALELEKPEVKFLVNAAGFVKIGKVEALSLYDETDMVRLNCEALCAVTHMVLPYMTGNSRIIQFASSAAFLPQPGFAVYSATKAFVLSYSRALNQELRGRNIYVTAVCPGPVRTEFFDIAETTGEIPLYKRLVMANPRRVVAKAIRDSVAGRDISVYGVTMKAFRLLCKALPHRWLLLMMERCS